MLAGLVLVLSPAVGAAAAGGSGSAAKDGSNMANARTVTMADGKRVFNAGSSGDAGTNGAGAAKQ